MPPRGDSDVGRGGHQRKKSGSGLEGQREAFLPQAPTSFMAGINGLPGY